MEPIVLASGSPRRQDYFRLLGLPFSVEPAMIDETPGQGLSPRQVAEDLALRKALDVAGRLRGRDALWVVGADTVVAVDGAVFGKPSGRDDARRMIERLSGREHEVITAVALHNVRRQTTDCRSASSRVSFAPLSGPEIEWYLDTGEWEGAAGSYQSQCLAACFIVSITGCPSTVVGLPLRDFYCMLRDNGYPYGACAPG